MGKQVAVIRYQKKNRNAYSYLQEIETENHSFEADTYKVDKKLEILEYYNVDWCYHLTVL